MSTASDVGEVSGMRERYSVLCRNEGWDGLEGLLVSPGSG